MAGLKVLISAQEKVAQSLSDPDVKISYDTEGKVFVDIKNKIIHLPLLPEKVDNDTMSLIRGYVDHETAHMKWTDPDAEDVLSKVGDGKRSLINALEDGRVNKLIGNMFYGCAVNIEQCKETIIKSMFPANASIANRAILALSEIAGGYSPDEVLSRSYIGNDVQSLFDKIKPEIELIKEGLQTSFDVIDVASSIYAKWKLVEEPPPLPSEANGGNDQSENEPKEDEQDQSSDQEQEQNQEKEQEKNGEESEEDKDDKDNTESNTEGNDEEDSEDSDDKDGQGNKDEQKDEEGKDSEKTENKEGNGSDNDLLDDEKTEDEKDDGDKKGEPDEQAGEEDSSEKEPSENKDEQHGDSTKDSGKDSKEFSTSPDTEADSDDFDKQVDLSTQVIESLDSNFCPGFADKLASTIEDRLEIDYKNPKIMSYRPRTCDDKIEKLNPSHCLNENAELELIEQIYSEAKKYVSALRQKLMLDLLSKGKGWVKRQDKGMIDDRSLHKVSVGSKDVFKRKLKQTKMDTAATLLVDASGSMQGSRLRIATQLALLFSETLELLKIPNEVLGFTTTTSSAFYDMRSEQADGIINQKRLVFNRISPLMLYECKEFTDSFRKAQISIGRLNTKADCYNNVDGESLLWAAKRLIARQEKRKILIVLTDGVPQAYPDETDLLGWHLEKTVKRIIAAGIQVIAIGIQHDGVSRFYPDYILCEELAEIPTIFYKKLSNLLKGIKNEEATHAK